MGDSKNGTATSDKKHDRNDGDEGERKGGKDEKGGVSPPSTFDEKYLYESYSLKKESGRKKERKRERKRHEERGSFEGKWGGGGLGCEGGSPKRGGVEKRVFSLCE